MGRRVRVRSGGAATKLGRVAVGIFAVGLLVEVAHPSSTPTIQENLVPPGAPWYCIGNTPSGDAGNATEAQIDRNCPQWLMYRQSLYQMNQQYAVGGDTTITYPWCVANQPCLPTPDMTTP